jgi:hypothetical protein
MNSNDPIIAAIDAHRRACAETRVALEHQIAVENELVARPGMLEGEPQNEWIAASAAAGEALALQDGLGVKLLETQPTTVAGAAALLTYYVDAVKTSQPDVVFPELNGNGCSFVSTSVEQLTRDFGYFIIRNVAAALGNMASAG